MRTEAKNHLRSFSIGLSVSITKILFQHVTWNFPQLAYGYGLVPIQSTCWQSCIEICGKFNLAYSDWISTISTVCEDNRAVKILATTDPPYLMPRSKHIAIRYHWFCSHVGLKDGSGIIMKDVALALNRPCRFSDKGLSARGFPMKLSSCIQLVVQCIFALKWGWVSHYTDHSICTPLLHIYWRMFYDYVSLPTRNHKLHSFHL